MRDVCLGRPHEVDVFVRLERAVKFSRRSSYPWRRVRSAARHTVPQWLSCARAPSRPLPPKARRLAAANWRTPGSRRLAAKHWLRLRTPERDPRAETGRLDSARETWPEKAALRTGPLPAGRRAGPTVGRGISFSTSMYWRRSPRTASNPPGAGYFSEYSFTTASSACGVSRSSSVLIAALKRSIAARYTESSFWSLRRWLSASAYASLNSGT